VVLGDYLSLSVAFLVSRTLLYWAGLRFKLDLTWMFLADTGELKRALAETIYTFHAFPPGMNVLTGLLLEVSSDGIEGAAFVAFVASGLVLANSMLYLSRQVGLGRLSSLCIAMVFALLPQTLYLENLYLYTYPAAALLLLATALFHRGLGQPSLRVWFAFFLVCAILGWLRSAFHLLWVLLMVGTVVLLARPKLRVRALMAALVPVCILLSVYLKNWAHFGVFGATSWGGANLIAVTTARMPEAERRSWVAEGKLSPFALISVFAPPRAYLHLLGNPKSSEWPELSSLERPSSGAGNFNHWYYLVVNPVRREDARRYLRERPGDYLKTVLTESLVQVFEPSTEWHPFDDKPGSPHFGHREVLGGYEAIYNRIVHRALLAPVGLYALLPLVLVYNVWWALRRLVGQATFKRDPRAVIVLFLCFQIVYVVAVSSLFTLGECARYRYLVEPSIWLLTAHAVARVFRALRTRRASGS
jgi:hypothetical protein